MARKTKTLTQPVLPSPSPSSDDGEDTAPTAPPPSSASALKPPRPNKPVSSSEEEEDDEEDSEEGSSSESEGSPPPPPPPPKKPPVVTSVPPSKKPPVTSPTRTKKPTPVTSPPPPPKPAQPSDSDNEFDSEPHPPAIAPEMSKKPEKKRKAADTPNGEPSTKRFMKVWTTDDITALMKGAVEFREKHGHEPTSTPNCNALLGMVKHQLHSEFATSQITTKFRNLKKKYVANLAKGKEVFSNEQDKLIYDLSKKVWGNLKASKVEVDGEAGEEGNSKPQQLGRKMVDGEAGEEGNSKPQQLGRKMNNGVVPGETVADGRSDDSAGLNWVVKLIMNEFGDGNLHTLSMLEQGLAILKPDVLSAFGEGWRDLNFEEFCVSNKRIQLKSEIVKAVENAMKSAGF